MLNKEYGFWMREGERAVTLVGAVLVNLALRLVMTHGVLAMCLEA